MSHRFFPTALERVGPGPDLTGLTPRHLAQELRGLQGALGSVLSFRFFIAVSREAGAWRPKPFGCRLKPLGIFSRAYQRDMQDLYAKSRAEPLDFGIGDRWRPNEVDLLLAVRRPVLRADVAP